MARIIIKPVTVYHLCVELTDDDIRTILAEAKRLNLTVSKLAKLLGISRPYFYEGMKSGMLELSRYLQLQNILSINLVSDDDIKASCDRLAFTLINSIPQHARL